MAGGGDRGAVLWNLTGDEVIGKPKRTLLPVLIALFVVSYGLLTMLVVEQARTIDSQRSLIGLLFDDSVQLASLRSKAIYKQNSAARAQRTGRSSSHMRKRRRHNVAARFASTVGPDRGHTLGGCQDPRVQQDAETTSAETSEGRVG